MEKTMKKCKFFSAFGGKKAERLTLGPNCRSPVISI
jgi:hypothetical protein